MKIVLAIDGSEQSYEAARALACLNPAKMLMVLHVLDFPSLSYPTLGPTLDKELSMSLEPVMRKEGQRFVDHVVSLLPPHHGPASKKLETGTPADIILSVAEDFQADLIVMGARGLGRLKGKMFGSVSHRVMSHAHCSVLVVKTPISHQERILCPVETESDGQCITNFFAKKPFRETPKVTVMHVIPFSEPMWPVGTLIPDSFRQEMVTQAEEFTNSVTDQLGTHGIQASGLSVMGSPSQSIVEEASTNHSDLIIMRSKNRSEISRFLLGSVSHSVVHDCSNSFLLVK